MEEMLSPQRVATELKRVRALASSEQHLCSVARGELERATQTLVKRARQHRNLLHSLEGLERDAYATFTPVLCSLTDPAVPPAALRRFLSVYGALITVLRRQPAALAGLLHRSGIAPASGAQLLLCCLYPQVWLPEEESALLRAIGRTIRLRAEEGDALAAGTLPDALISGFLRTMPGGAVWLQAAIGAQLERVIRESEQGLDMVNDGAALCAGCEALLEATLAVMGAVPVGLRQLGAAILASTRTASSDGSGASPAGASECCPPSEGCPKDLEMLRRLLVGMLLSRAAVRPEAYGVEVDLCRSHPIRAIPATCNQLTPTDGILLPAQLAQQLEQLPLLSLPSSPDHHARPT